MTCELNIEQLQQCLPKNKDIVGLYAVLSELLPKYEINTVNRIAGFLAQCGHESSEFNVLEENLNYSAQSLANTWPNRYSKTQSKPYEPNDLALQIQRNPEAIANNTYANRMGNGSVQSGDGWRYRGRGAIQLTGYDNYKKFAEFMGMTVPETSEYCGTLMGAIESACWYWKIRDINSTCDANDIVTMTKRINGGTIGLDDRTKKYENNKIVLS